jgi:hypothetical protein
MHKLDNKKGHYFKKGALWVFDGRWETHVRGWPDPKSIIRLRHNKWKSDAPEFRLVSPPQKKHRKRRDDGRQLALPMDLDSRPREVLVSNKNAAFLSFRASLPDELVRSIESFRSHQWALIVMAHVGGSAALDLMNSNPVLAYVLANAREFYEILATPEEKDQALRILNLKQRRIAKCLLFPDKQATVSLMKRIRPESVNREIIGPLRLALKKDPTVAQVLARIEQVNAGVLGVVLNKKLGKMYTSGLLGEIARSSREHYHPFAMHTLEEVAYMSRVGRPKKIPPQFSSLKRLNAYHEELSSDFEKVGAHKLRYCRIPEPPLAGTDSITPVHTLTQLKKEGKEQSHCVASYSRRIAQGGTYVYRVLKPERATLSIVRDSGGRWCRGELYCAGNHPVSDDTVRAVDEWLESSSMSA